MSGHSKTYAVDGLVLREAPHGENDCLISLLTAEKGRITVLGKGARSIRSRVRGGIQPYTYGNYEIASKDGPGWLRSLSVNESFLGLRTGLLTLSLAAYLADVAYELSGEGVPAGELLQLMLNTYYLLSNRIDPDDEAEILRIKAAFELRVMAISGYEPDLSSCGRCGGEEDTVFYLDVMNGGLLCGDCVAKSAAFGVPAPDPHDVGSATILLPLTGGALDAMRYVTEAPPKRIYAFSLPDDGSLRNFSKVAETYLENHLERTFDSLEFFRTMLK